jgi:hypothetical protein
MVIIHIQVGKNIIDNAFIDGGVNVNIITKNLIIKFGLPKSILVPYHLKMVDQSMTVPLGIIRNLKFHLHGIPL